MLLDDLPAEDLVRADAAVVAALRVEAADRKPYGRPSFMNVYSCSMPNHGSCLGVLLRRLDQGRLVFVGCGLPSAPYTSHITRTLWPPRIGSGQWNTGLSTQSLAGLAFVLEPSKPQIGSSASSGTIFVFERNLAVGSVPSIQMYSAL